MGGLQNTTPASEDGFVFPGARTAALEGRTAGGLRLSTDDAVLEVMEVLETSETEAWEVAPQRSDADMRAEILALYDEYRPRLFRYLRSLKLNRDQAEETIQETFMRLTTQLLQGKDIENVQGWIVRVAHNLAVDSLKGTGRELVAGPESSFALSDHVDPRSGPEDVYLEKEQIRRMEAALATLNPQQRESFQMRAQGFRYKDIGLALKISEQRAALVVKQVAVRLAAICG